MRRVFRAVSPLAILSAVLVGALLVPSASANPDPRSESEPVATTARGSVAASFSESSAVSAIDVPASTVVTASFGGDPDGFAELASEFMGMPTSGDSAMILSTGRASEVMGGNPSDFISTELPGSLSGADGNDLTQFRLSLKPPKGATCLAFDFAFGSEEYPEYVGSGFNDVFTAEAGGSEFTFNGNQVTSAYNFAFDSRGNPVSINTVFGMNTSPSATRLDGFTSTLSARTPVKRDNNGHMAVTLSIQDIGDSVYDSAVIIDNMRWRAGTNCDQGATTENRYVAMGDSFSSGEGVAPYLPGTDSADNRCHRSTSAYSKVVETKSTTKPGTPVFVACSGAVTNDLFEPNHLGNKTSTGQVEAPQLEALDANTTLVTITIGGNDLGFAEVLTSCVVSSKDPDPKCRNKNPKLTKRVAYFTTAFPAIAAPVKSAVGTPIRPLVTVVRGIRARAPEAKIIVLGYPSLVSVGWGGKRCVAGALNINGGALLQAMPVIYREDATWLDSQSRALDLKMMSAVTQSGVSNIEYVSTVPRFIGHGVCSKSQWIHPISGSVTLKDWKPINVEVDSKSFHPNWIGQRAYAGLVLEELDQ